MTHTTFLVVDDDDRLRHTLSLLLRTAGTEVVAAADVPGAAEVLRARDIDLVISDGAMPGGSGVAARLRADAAVPQDLHRRVPAIRALDIQRGGEDPRALVGLPHRTAIPDDLPARLAVRG